jgi:(S)-ureidoglycine aminohydrolase
MGAEFNQVLTTLNADGLLEGDTSRSQAFFYVVTGRCKATAGGEEKLLTEGQYLYIPVNKEYVIESAEDGTQLLSFHKPYESLNAFNTPAVLFGDAALVEAPVYLGDHALRLQVLLPGDLSFDMAVNIFTYAPGGHLPFVETHVMEHGLMYLGGQGIYMLDHQWYPIKKGDSIWMAPYCQQWFTAMGKEPAVYIYYKNVNRSTL